MFQGKLYPMYLGQNELGMISVTAEEIDTLEIKAVSSNYSAIDINHVANIGVYLHGENIYRVTWNKLFPTVGCKHVCRVIMKELFSLFAESATHINQCLSLSHWTKGCCSKRKENCYNSDSDMFTMDDESSMHAHS